MCPIYLFAIFVFVFFSDRLTEAQQKLDVFSLLDDSITEAISISDDPNMSRAQSFIRILKEKKYRVEHYPNNADEVRVSFSTTKLNIYICIFCGFI